MLLSARAPFYCRTVTTKLSTHTRCNVRAAAYNHRIEQAVAGYFALGAGKSFTRGLSQPDAALSSEDSS
jgi:hypothetical protein